MGQLVMILSWNQHHLALKTSCTTHHWRQSLPLIGPIMTRRPPIGQTQIFIQIEIYPNQIT